MSLAAPIFLAALGLLVPILITFLVKRRRRVVRVPSTMLWRLGAKSISRSRRIRNVRRLVALLACLAGAGLLALAAARPGGKGIATAVYVVDTSASMAGAPIEEARRYVRREVAALGPNGRVAIVVAGDEARVLLPPTSPGPLVDRAIAQIEAAKETAAMDEAIGLGEGLGVAHHARVVVLSDRPLDRAASRVGGWTEQRVVGRGGKSDNLGIVSLFTRTAPDARDDEERDATVVVATSSTSPRRGRLVVTFAGRVVADRSIDVPAQGEHTENVTLRGGGKLVARIASDDGRSDALAIDDEASLEETARKPPKVTLVRDKEDTAATYFFVSRALSAAGVTDVDDVASNSAPPKDAGDVAVVLRDGPGRPRGVPAFYVGVAADELEIDAHHADKSGAHLRSIAAEDPLMRGVALDELTSLRALVGAPPHGARSLVDLDAGPALIAGGSGKNAWVWLGLDLERSDLVLKVAFPVLVGNVLTQLGGATQVISAKTVPRDEVMLEGAAPAAALPDASEPRWRIPLSPPALIALLGGLLLAFEAWLSLSCSRGASPSRALPAGDSPRARRAPPPRTPEIA
ncbi:MAG: BatA domain-containing protein [Labilithrix sp.]|nr:BatA domain-containing protein [Labilithrix sp.]MCW5817692.1 BatA domain-containing protein [Labilithrix sp.]